MIQPIKFHQINFGADTVTKDPKTGEYRDPLMKWPMRGMAFTNEIGESLRPLIGGAATLFWAPVFLYIGADVYDKYKNDKNEYSPDSRRCLKQAIFQGLASMLLPLVAIHGGQDIFSLFGLVGKDKLSYNTQEHITKLAQQYVANGKMKAFEGKDSENIENFVNLVRSNLDYKFSKKALKGSLRKFLKVDKTECIDRYAKDTITKLINTKSLLLNPSDEFKKSGFYSDFILALECGQTENVAVKSILSKFLKKSTLTGKLFKTIGGFAAFSALVGPIDKFVEHIVIDKYIGPSIDKTKKSAN